jgi:hypothetical protein
MQYLINDLKNKVSCLKSESSPKLIEEIASILRSIRNRGAVPEYMKGELAEVLVELARVYPRSGSDSVPHLVIGIIDQLRGPKPQSTAGSASADSQTQERKDVNDPLSAFRILGKLNFRLWS